MIATAYAQQPASTPTAGQSPAATLGSFVPMILIFVVFYVLLIRPQQKQQKLHRQMISSAQRGDEIVTSGGIHGKVTDTADDHVKVQIDERTTIKLDRSHIQSIKGYKEEDAKK